jgi:outer membrane receptor protein involved in Fe transport
MKKELYASASAITLAFVPMVAHAQTAGPETTEAQSTAVATEERPDGEIIVTATRRNARLQDVPVAVTAYSQAELTTKGIVGYEGIAHETPGVIVNRPSANFNNFTARGIATNGYNANLQGTVAIYIDELPISANGNSTILDPTLFDVERVEFLRGPQGTLFGSGSLAGAMRILTKSPNLSTTDYALQGDFGLTGSDSFRQRYNGMVNVPLVEDKLGLRIVGFYRHEEGYLDNIGTGEHNSNTLEAWGGRAILLWEPTDRLSLRFTAAHEDSYPEDSSLVSAPLEREQRRSDRPDLFTAELTTYNMTFDYQFDGARLTSSSTAGTFDQRFFVDLANTFAFALPFRLDALAYDDLFVQETRLASDAGGNWDWVIGGFYYYKRRDVDYIYRASDAYLAQRGFTGLPTTPGIPRDTYNYFGIHTKSNELAGFGEITYRFSDKFWLTGGLRYGSTDAQTTTENFGYNSNYLARALTPGATGPLTIVPIVAGTGPKAKADKLSYKLSASFKPSPALTTYATVATGFRTPIINARGGAVSLVDPTDIVIPAGASSDKLTSYELGVKGRWLEGALTANVAAYYIDWKNIQVQANRVSDSIQFATNIGGAVSKGLEFEVVALPSDSFTLSFNGSLNDANVNRLTPVEAAISGAVDGARLAAPKFQGAATARYNFDLSDTTQGFASGTIAHVGSYPGMFPRVPGRPAQIAPTFAYTESFENVNLALGITRGPLAVTAYVENLFDDHSITYVHPEAFLASRFGMLRPRTVGIRIGYSL